MAIEQTTYYQGVNHDRVLGHLGPSGTFTEKAAQDLQNNPDYAETTLLKVPSIDQVCDLVEQGGIDYAIIPYYNSTGGPVKDTFEALARRNLIIRGELDLRIVQCLYMQEGVPAEKIEAVLSKDQALLQTTEHLDEIFGPENITHKRVAIESTAKAVIEAAKNPKYAAVASTNAADALVRDGNITQAEYDRLIRLEGIQDSDNNLTRFIIVQRPGSVPMPLPTDHDITTALISIDNRPGSLYDFLDVMANAGKSITKIKSCDAQEPDKMSFLISVEEHPETHSLTEVVNQLHDPIKVKELGTYPRSNHMDPEKPDAPTLNKAEAEIQKRLATIKDDILGQTSLVFTLRDSIGALRNVLKPFRDAGLDLTDIDSLPSGRSLDEHIFYLRYRNNPDINLDTLMEEITRYCTGLKVVTI